MIVLLLLTTAFLYRVAPNVQLSLKWIAPGAIVFVAGWLGATYLFTLYVANFGSYAATYGALAGVAVLLIWFYLTAFVLLAGAELNAVLTAQMAPAQVDEQRRGAGRELADSHP